jgi:hypothetical protein
MNNMSKTVTSKASLNLVVAHMLEARPLIDALALQATEARPYKLFSNEQGLNLIVCGNGKLAAASATAWLAGRQHPQPAPAWLNIGICGHGVAALGSGLLVNKISDASSGASFYPSPWAGDQPSTALITVDQPEGDYPEACAYDMEAAAFWPLASKIAGIDLVHCFKIVSDNPEHGLEKFAEAQVAALFDQQLPAILKLIEQLQNRASEQQQLHAAPEACVQVLDRLHFTVNQRLQLLDLGRRFKALDKLPLLSRYCDQFNGGAGQLLSQLRGELDGES